MHAIFLDKPAIKFICLVMNFYRFSEISFNQEICKGIQDDPILFWRSFKSLVNIIWDTIDSKRTIY